MRWIQSRLLTPEQTLQDVYGQLTVGPPELWKSQYSTVTSDRNEPIFPPFCLQPQKPWEVWALEMPQAFLGSFLADRRLGDLPRNFEMIFSPETDVLWARIPRERPSNESLRSPRGEVYVCEWNRVAHKLKSGRQDFKCFVLSTQHGAYQSLERIEFEHTTHIRLLMYWIYRSIHTLS